MGEKANNILILGEGDGASCKGVGVVSEWGGGLVFFINFPATFLEPRKLRVSHLVCVTSERGLKYGVVSANIYEFS